MFDILKLIAKKEQLQIALEGITLQKKPNYRDMTCADCSGHCKYNCSAQCKSTNYY